MHSVKINRKEIVISALFAALLGLSACSRTQDPAALVQEARKYQQNGDAKAAIIQLKNALQAAPENGEARLALGEVYGESGDAVSSEKELRKAISVGIPHNRAALSLGRALLAQGAFQKALDETAPTAGVTETAELMSLRGDALLALGKRESAQSAYERALVLRPDHAAALVGMARCAAAASDAEGAIRLADQAVSKNPNDAAAWTYKGDLARARGNGEDALKAYDEALKASPNDVNARIARATLRIAAAKFDDAKADIDAARKIRPNALMVFYTQALLEFNQGKYLPARESLQQVLRAAPENMPALLLAGAVEYSAGSNEQAEHYLVQYTRQFPDNLYARKLLASVYLKSGQMDKVMTTLGPALADGGKDPQALMIAGEASMRDRDFSKATDYFEKANTLTPKVAAVHTALGMSRMGQGDTARGVAELELASSLDNKSAQSGVLLVTTQIRLKQFDKALVSVTALEKQQPTDPAVQNLKGGVYLGLKDRDKARASFEKALTLSPAYLPAIENLARMDLDEKHPELAKKRFEALLQADKNSVPAMTALAALAQSGGQTVEATTWLEKAAAVNVDAVAPALRLGAQYLRTGAKDKALVLAKKLFASNDNNPEVLDFLGQAQAANQDKEGALATFKRLSAAQPTSAAAQLRIAAIEAAMQNFPNATASLNKALALQPDNVEAQVALISVYEATGNFDGALKVAGQMQKQRPKQASGFVLEGDILMAQKKPVPAQKAYENAFSLAKSGQIVTKLQAALVASGKDKEADARTLQWLKDNPADTGTRVYLAGSMMSRGHAKAAIEQYEIALKAAPQNPAILNNLAYAYQQEKDPRALETAEAAFKAAPESPIVMDTLGWILVDKGNDPRGLDLLRKAGAAAPKVPDIHLHLAVGLMKTGDKVGARKELEQLVELKTYPKLEEAKRLLKEL